MSLAVAMAEWRDRGCGSLDSARNSTEWKPRAFSLTIWPRCSRCPNLQQSCCHQCWEREGGVLGGGIYVCECVCI